MHGDYPVTPEGGFEPGAAGEHLALPPQPSDTKQSSVQGGQNGA